MSGFELAILWTGWALAGASPGPATLSIAGTAMRAGRRAALVFSLGILAGSASLGIAAAFGMGAIMMTNAWVVELVRYLGAGYLLYLAFRSLRSALQPGSSAQQKGHDGTAAQLFLRGLLIHLTNPKAILSWGAIFAVTLGPDAALGDVFAMFAFLFCGSVIVFPGYAMLFSTSRVVALYARARRGFEAVFAAFFGTVALSILTAKLT
ncbi:MAG: LysE family translocator [Rhodobacteraceae bacterium]|nr:LysE family translocator [Paracoccaceae bacterium]